MMGTTRSRSSSRKVFCVFCRRTSSSMSPRVKRGLGHGHIACAKQPLVYLHQTALAHRRSSLVFRKVLGPFMQAKFLEARHHRTGGYQ